MMTDFTEGIWWSDVVFVITACDSCVQYFCITSCVLLDNVSLKDYVLQKLWKNYWHPLSDKLYAIVNYITTKKLVFHSFIQQPLYSR